MNRIAFRTAGFREWPIAEALTALGELGYWGVELCLEHPDMRPESLSFDRCAEIADLVTQAGLQIASVSYHGDREEPVQRRANQLRAIALTFALGSDLLILNAEHLREGEAQRQWDDFAATLDGSLLPAAAAAQVNLALEPEPGMFLHGTAEMLRLLDELPHPRLGCNLDIGHAWLTDDDLGASVAALGDRIFHVHWEDFPTGEHKHLVPGTGDMPLGAIHQALGAVGYDGPYTVDLFNITDDPVAYARASLIALHDFLAAEGG
jgi:sugar phosphate isomerase/epimerase